MSLGRVITTTLQKKLIDTYIVAAFAIGWHGQELPSAKLICNPKIYLRNDQGSVVMAIEISWVV
jgi:hypothetical protein